MNFLVFSLFLQLLIDFVLNVGTQKFRRSDILNKDGLMKICSRPSF
jgi:hypothetical protein